MNIFVPEPLGFTKLSHFSVMQDDALMHREGLKGFKPDFHKRGGLGKAICISAVCQCVWRTYTATEL